MSHDTLYYDPAAYAQAYSQYGYDQYEHGQTTSDYTQATTQVTTQSTTQVTTQATTQTFAPIPEETKPASYEHVNAVAVIAVILVTVTALLAGTVLLVVLGAAYGVGTETEVHNYSDSTPVPSVHPVVRFLMTSSVMTPATNTTVTPNAPTQSPRRVMNERPLVCTMGSRTSFTQMFPPDGFCEYIFFDSVEKDRRNPLASPNLWANDLRIFVAAYARYSTTAFGIGFSYDKAFTLVLQLNTTNSSLLEPFWRRNIFHFGMLDTATINAREPDVELALNLLKLLDTHAEKQRQRGNPSFIFFAGVVFNDNWKNFYNDKFTNLYKPDLFIAQGHFFYGDNTFPNCRVMPPTALSRPPGVDNSYQHDLTLAADSFGKLSLGGRSIIWAISVTMKGRWTTLPPSQGLDDFLSRCVHNASAPSFGRYSDVCRNTNFLRRSYSQTQDAILAVHNTDGVLFAYDNEVGLCRKLCALKAQRLSVRFGIAVYDLEYEDFLNSCGGTNKYGAFSRLHALRRILNYIRTMFNRASDAARCRRLIT